MYAAAAKPLFVAAVGCLDGGVRGEYVPYNPSTDVKCELVKFLCTLTEIK